jgi:hypothetical protein
VSPKQLAPKLELYPFTKKERNSHELSVVNNIRTSIVPSLFKKQNGGHEYLILCSNKIDVLPAPVGWIHSIAAIEHNINQA